MADRAKKLEMVFDAICEGNAELRTELLKRPDEFGKEYGLTFSDEERFLIKNLKDPDVDVGVLLRAMSPVGFWDNNCCCSGGGTGPARW